MKRKVYQQLLDWKHNRHGEVALLIEGARRIGKSYIVEAFAKNEYDSYILIDFSRVSSVVMDFFNLYLDDLDMLLSSLELYSKKKLTPRMAKGEEAHSLVIFDEIQFCPRARAAIKHLVADGRYDYIETGSLISIKKNVKDILIPSEEEKLFLYPMDYEEFKWALGDNTAIPQLRMLFDKKLSIGDAVTRKLMRDFRIYMVVGGMPQAVDTYIDTNNLMEVDRVKRNIIQLYEDDFYKIDSSGRLSMLFDAIPAQLNSNASRYQVASAIGNNTDSEKVLQLISELRESMTINMAYHANDPGVGMSLVMNLNKYKMYIGDTGLFITLAFKDKDFTENIIYQKLMSDKLDTNLGYVYENMVAQMLTATGNRLFYYTFPTETGKHNYEIDFLLSRGNKICPIEVKSSGYKRHTSLDAFCQKFSNRILQRYIIYTKDLQKDEQTLFLPVYLTQFL